MPPVYQNINTYLVYHPRLKLTTWIFQIIIHNNNKVSID